MLTADCRQASVEETRKARQGEAVDEPDLSPARLDTFSDGVMAIAVTVMLLDLKPPEGGTPAALMPLWPGFLSYLISFGFVVVFWVNHRHILRPLTRLSERVLWSNVIFLFLITLIPFSTGYMSRSGLAPFPTALYAGVLAACGVTFGILRAFIASEIEDDALRQRFGGRKIALVGAATIVLLVASAIVAYTLSSLAALGLIVLSSTLHFAPITRR